MAIARSARAAELTLTISERSLSSMVAEHCSAVL
jgi:hypothetical protein